MNYCHGHFLSVFTIVSQLEGREDFFPVVVFTISTFQEFGYVCIMMYNFPFPQYVTKSPTRIIPPQGCYSLCLHHLTDNILFPLLGISVSRPLF